MFGLVEPYSGHYYEAEWIEWDETVEDYKTPVKITVKGNSSIGVSTGIREQVRVQESNGRWVVKDTLKVHAVNNHPYKPQDVIRLLKDNSKFTIAKVTPDFNHPNSIGNLMFKQNDNVPKVLYLGDS